MPKTEPGGTRRILLVEDHPVERAYLQNVLLALGFRRVAGLGSSIEAVSALARQFYDVVISDIVTGEGDGTRLPNELRRLVDAGRLKSMPPIIWISSLSDELLQSHVRLALQAGCPSAQALSKPVSRTGLQQAIKTALRSVDEDDTASPRQRSLRRDVIEAALGHALITGQGMSVVLQPQMSLSTGRVLAAEALSRWDHPELGAIPAADFVPAAHRLGLDRTLFCRVTDRVLEVLQRMHAEDIAVPVAINASASTLCSRDLPGLLEQRVGQAGLPARLVKVELTEDEPVTDWLALSSALNLLRVRGFELAMDDFGAGIASMRLFSAMPFTELKIDRDFIVHMHREPASRAVVAAAIEMGRVLGRRVVAEGVEHERDIELLRELGCDVAQGYGISVPLEPDAFIEFCRTH
ncbi:EAL domain-containing response regulator [Achromobacter insolitus]|jgi:EAL domain-containing protein (putative c-di-GMP-specific phosphodiesterase class I)/CheY-like chemotaxis protein|uniref:Sensor histidine kinase RcsC n=1 Tax=Achromobacter insolitus TaxID=217204 RepID=A0A6S7EW32_9BURK|nr:MULTISPECIES: EAL domain-containing response regulator [Achromobacter]GLK93504.1 diguanylate phosphodiesterase [Achromobacter xylosoxidans]APX74517.1 diguanylate phosphodiesterase [Achromobacter insolitus]AVG39410.1 diguanylate phosphodiesterase [Achromobacter insolitus]AXA70084.1 diguanylate phosphodiesterase [Achromobacter insolitus]MDH3064592.1 EAL domain-containing response regulator [Achromobacter insolitus]